MHRVGEAEMRSVKRMCFNTAESERSGWRRERKRERPELEVFLLRRFLLRRTHAAWTDTVEKRCDVVACLNVCVCWGSSSCVTSASAMEGTLHINICRLCFL